MPGLFHQQNRLHLFLVMIAILTSSFASSAPILAASSAAQPLCLDGKIWDAETETCVDLEEAAPTEEPEPTAEPTEEPVPSMEPTEEPELPVEPTAEPEATMDDESDEDADLVPSGDNSARITMYSHSCRSDFNIRNATVDERITGCNGWVSQATYRLDVDGVPYGTIISPDGVGGNSWTEVATGLATVTQLTPPTHTGPGAAYCATSALMTEQRNVAFTFNSQEPAFRIELKTDDIWYCNTYFNEMPTGSVTATLWECPADFDMSIAEPDTLKSTCRGFMPNVEFMLLHDVAGVSITYTSSASKAIFYQISEGNARLRMSVPSGFSVPRVFCEVIGPQGQTLRQYDQEFVGNDASIAVSFDDLETTFCNWYTVQGGNAVELPDQSLKDQGFPPGTSNSGLQIFDIDEIDEVALPPPTTTPEPDFGSEVGPIDDIDTVELPDDSPGKVTIVASQCPDSFEGGEASAEDFNLNCPYLKRTVVEFSLTDSSGAFELQHTEPGLPLVEFETVAPGWAEVTAAGSTGSGKPAVFCQTIPAGGGQATPYTQQVVLDGNVVQLRIDPSAQTICDWFIVPLP